MIDTNDCTSLKYVPTTKFNGVEFAKLKKEYVNVEIEYWQFAILCTVLVANPLIHVTERFVRRIWIDTVILVKGRIYFIRFCNL